MKKVVFAALLLLALPRPAEALQADELLALVAMPLAVAAVAELDGVPQPPLFEVISALNDAAFPPTEFIETVRYIPVALVAEARPAEDFVRFVTLRRDEGLRGEPLVVAVQRELVTYGVPQTEFALPPLRFVTSDYLPPLVVTRVRDWRDHPHGGPPGQLKKITGEQSAARIAHERKDRDDGVVLGDRDRDDRPRKEKIEKHQGRGQGRSGGPKEKGNDGGKGHGKGGKGKG